MIPGGVMKINVDLAANELMELVSKTNRDLKPIFIKSNQGNAVLIAESEWNSIAETLYLFQSLENAKILIDSEINSKELNAKGKSYSFEDLDTLFPKKV
jgi:PHD/YefM family antitoxin component YafN of YafNO toxin-antitoxin module